MRQTTRYRSNPVIKVAPVLTRYKKTVHCVPLLRPHVPFSVNKFYKLCALKGELY